MTNLCNTLKINQNISTAYHPQTDGQSERSNQKTEIYLRCFGDERQDDWHFWLPMAEFALNQWPSATTKKTPFEMIMGYNPKTEWMNKPCPVPEVERRLEQLEEVQEAAYQNVAQSAKDDEDRQTG